MNNPKHITYGDFEQKEKELTEIIYALTDKRYKAAPFGRSPVARALSESVLTLQAAMRTFSHIYNLSEDEAK